MDLCGIEFIMILRMALLMILILENEKIVFNRDYYVDKHHDYLSLFV